MPRRGLVGNIGSYLLSAMLVAVCAAALHAVPAITPAAAAPVLLLIILLVARARGVGPALAASLSAGASFSYFFLPLSGAFATDLSDWVAFLTFTITAVVVGELAAQAERRQHEAEQGRREIEQLYQQLGAAFERASEAEAARRNEQLKAALLDALTHNLRTPLTSIKASVTALIGSPQPPPPAEGLSLEQRGELLRVIDEESDRLNRFIDGLSAADRPDPSQPSNLRGVRLDGIVREAVTRAGSVLRRHRVQVALDAELPALGVDPAAVAEVLYILLDNASKYTPVGSLIQVVAGAEDEHHVRVSVIDEGPGIPEELRQRVFEKFYRIPGREAIDSWRTGIGLGLPIAQRLVESQAGRIWIDAPASGPGTRINMSLPIGKEIPPPSGLNSREMAAATGER